MHIMEDIRKFFRIVGASVRMLYGLMLIIVGWWILSMIAAMLGGSLFNIWHLYGKYIYIVIALFFVARNTYHRFKWYVCANPIKIRCSNCQSVEYLERYGEKRFLKAPMALYIESLRYQFKFVGERLVLFELFYRPYLQLDCPECREKQVICPYCHEPIPPEEVKCYYDRPSVCSHCGKKIYTPLPLRDSKDLIEVGEF